MAVIKLCLLVQSLVAIIHHDHDVMSMAMVIDAHTKPMPTMPASSKTVSADINIRNSSVRRYRQFRIRRTRAADLDAISTMLAMEAVPSRDTWNWNHDMERLRAKSTFRQQLGHRLAAIEEGRETANTLNCDILLESEMDTCHLLWANDNFRSKIKTAVAHSQEENAWLFHNFDHSPSSELLNHVMMSVEEISTGGVVGFCEVAWLPYPSSFPSILDNGDMAPMITNRNDAAQRIHVSEDSLKIQPTLSSMHCETMPMEQSNPLAFAPAIVNLVTSSSHRRKGIASRILNFASKYTQTQWNCHDDNDVPACLGLYVHPQNEAALMLYRTRGFSVMTSNVDNGLLYLTQRR